MALIPPEPSFFVGCAEGSATAMYPPMYHMHSDPPIAPYINRERRPSLSMRRKSQTRVTIVFITPKTPVVSKDVDVPVIPIDLKMVGESARTT
jgi:hypothetical protein